MPALFEVAGLCAGYGKVEAIHDIHITVQQGQIVSLVGPNGAGKTTTLMAMMGAIASTGRIGFAGQDISRLSLEQRFARGLSLVPEKRELFGGLSVLDNLRLGAFRRHLRRDGDIRQDLDEVFTLFPRLHERQGQEARTLSGGERQMLALARALMGKPRLLLLDEPSLGLSPTIVEQMFAIIVRLKSLGYSILLVEQNVRASLEISDAAYVLDTGAIVASGSAREIASDPQLIASYLGGTA